MTFETINDDYWAELEKIKSELLTLIRAGAISDLSKNSIMLILTLNQKLRFCALHVVFTESKDDYTNFLK